MTKYNAINVSVIKQLRGPLRKEMKRNIGIWLASNSAALWKKLVKERKRKKMQPGEAAKMAAEAEKRNIGVIKWKAAAKSQAGLAENGWAWRRKKSRRKWASLQAGYYLSSQSVAWLRVASYSMWLNTGCLMYNKWLMSGLTENSMSVAWESSGE